MEMVKASWYVLISYYPPQISLRELVLGMQLMEIIRRVYTCQLRRHPFL